MLNCMYYFYHLRMHVCVYWIDEDLNEVHQSRKSQYQMLLNLLNSFIDEAFYWTWPLHYVCYEFYMKNL